MLLSPQYLPFLLMVAMFVLATHVHALPPDIEQLVQTSQYAEALAKVDVLLKDKPDDAELLAARKELQNLLPKAGTPTSPTPAPVPSAPAVNRSELPPIDARMIGLILAELGNTAGDGREKLLKQLMDRTEAFIVTYPDSINLWAIRGLAALELNNEKAAKTAGTNLLRLGADRSANEQMLNLLAKLKLNDWLLTQQELDVQERAAEAEKQAAAVRAEQKAEADRKAAAVRTANQREAERKAAAYRASPEGIAERLRKSLK